MTKIIRNNVSLKWREHFCCDQHFRVYGDMLGSFSGMVIWTADDLSTKSTDDATEWNWILHNLFSTGDIEQHSLDMAGTIAGISVGCFVLGTLLGFALGCAVMRKRMQRKGLRLPFHRDEEETDFHDDDNTL